MWGVGCRVCRGVGWGGVGYGGVARCGVMWGDVG